MRGFRCDALAKHGWNRYVYSGDDPVNYADPTGMLPVPGRTCGVKGGPFRAVTHKPCGRPIQVIALACGAYGGGIAVMVIAKLPARANPYAVLACSVYSIYWAIRRS